MTKLLFCVLVYRCCQSLELLCAQNALHISLQRLARIMSTYACLVQAKLLGISAQRLWEHALSQHIFYEPRNDRQNFCQLFAKLAA